MTTLSPIPPFPALSDRAAGTYNSKAYAFGNHMGAVFQPEMAALMPELQSAATASAAAIASANYKGPWASLTGPLAIPASVFHGSAVYMLTESVANVAAEVPGVSAKWIAVSAAPVLELISTTNATAVATVEWTNFDTLAAMYAALRLVGEGIVGSEATADLQCTLRQNSTWIAAGGGINTSGFPADNATGGASAGALSSMSALKNVSSQALSFNMEISAFAPVARPNIWFSLMEATNSMGSTAANNIWGYLSTVRSWTPTTGLQGLRINASTGNLTGTFRLYGVRK